MLLRAPRCDSLPDPYISLILLTRNAMIYYCRHKCGKTAFPEAHISDSLPLLGSGIWRHGNIASKMREDTPTYRHAKFDADRLHRHRDIRNWTKKIERESITIYPIHTNIWRSKNVKKTVMGHLLTFGAGLHAVSVVWC